MKKDKNLWTARGVGEKIKYYRSFNERDEAQYVIRKIKEMVNKGIEYKDMAILYRTNAQSRVLEEEMLKEPKNWCKHYHGDDKAKAFARKYSFSDRARYYIGDGKVQNSIDKLLANLEETGIPMSILHQYLPKQYDKIVAGELENKPVELIKDGVVLYMEDYEYAAF